MLQWDLLYYLIVVVIVVIVVVLMVITHAGFFYTIRLRMVPPPVMPHHVAYILRTGPYKNVGQTFKSLSILAPNTKLFGIYYDDPDTVPQQKLRCLVGCCLPDPLERSGGSKDLEARLQRHGYHFHMFPSCDKAVVTEFPWRNPLSILLAILFVYPALKKYVKDYKINVGPCIEYYEKDFIRFITPMDHFEEFYVPGIEPTHR